jgi:hypothetical protein
LNGVDKPALPLQPMPQVLRLLTSALHRSHAVNEIQDWLTGLVAFEISEYLVAVINGGNRKFSSTVWWSAVASTKRS